MTAHNFRRGDQVVFGRPNGEQTLGEVVKVNRKNLKVKQLEERGSRRVRSAGTIWTVHPSLCRHAEAVEVYRAPNFDELPQGTYRKSTGRKRTVRCSWCRQLGHNARGCPERKSGNSGPAPRSKGASMPPARSEKEIMKDILTVYAQLSPENLSCDGELPMAQVRKRHRALTGKLHTLFAELGREVDEVEAYRYAGLIS